MSKARFVGEYLIDEDTKKPLPVTKEEIVAEAINFLANTDRISDIIFLAVQKITGRIVIKNRYRESNLFNEIEQMVNSTEQYKNRRKQFQEKVKKISEDKEDVKMSSIFKTEGKRNYIKRYKKSQIIKRSG